MLSNEERSTGALLLALLAVALLASAVTSAWFHYDFTSGRQTAPDGPHDPEVTGIQRNEIDFYATQWEGNIDPSDPAQAKRAFAVIQYGMLASAVALALVALGEIPYVASILRRRVGLAFSSIALVALAAVAVAAWVWLPGSVGGYGVESPYTAHLVEPDGYTRTSLDWGWYATILAWAAAFGAGLFKFQAGNADPSVVERYEG